VIRPDGKRCSEQIDTLARVAPRRLQNKDRMFIGMRFVDEE
jgi:hypothetical protein